MNADDLSDADREALTRCFRQIFDDQDRGPQIVRLLQELPWCDVAAFCSDLCQDNALGLRPWQSPPSWMFGGGDRDRYPDAAALADRLRAAGLSVYEPDPLGALAKVEPPPPTSPRRPGARRTTR